MKQEIKSLETQRVIINSAFRLFYKKGYVSTSIPEIVKDTGLSKGAFYHHFQDKNDVGQRVVEEMVRKRIYDGMIAPLKNIANNNVLSFLIGIFSQRIKSFTIEEKKLGCPANNLINEIGYEQGRLRDQLRDLMNEWKDELIKVLERGKINGDIKQEVDVHSTAVYLISAFEGVRGLRKVYDDDKILEDYVEGVSKHLKSLA